MKRLKKQDTSADEKRIQRESRVWVNRTIELRGQEIGGDIATDLIQVHEFVTEPARVGLEKTLPIQLAKYLIGRVNVTVVIPCYKEEIARAREKLPGFVDKFLTEEAATLPDLLQDVTEMIQQ